MIFGAERHSVTTMSRLPTMATKAPKRATDADREIGNRVAELRIAQGLSQAALGVAIGVSFQQVQKYEKGYNRIGAGRLQAIAGLLKVPVEMFFNKLSKSETDVIDIQAPYNKSEIEELVTEFLKITDKATRVSVLSIVKASAHISS